MNKNYKEFLLKTAFLPSITTSMARTLTGKVDANRILSSLSSNHIFTEKFSTHAMFYQYHPLFREFVRAAVEYRCAREIGVPSEEPSQN